MIITPGTEYFLLMFIIKHQRNKQPYSSIYIYDFNSDSVYTQGSSGYKKMILAIEY